MSSLNAAARAKLPLADFAWPEERKYPIMDQSDVDAAARLIGRAPADKQSSIKSRIISIAKRKGFSIPDAWKSADMALFALGDATPDGDYVLRTGKIFESGQYDDKDFSLSVDELLAAVDGFQPAPIDLEHTDTLLSGKLGELRSVTASEDGRDLYGTVALPRWLDDVLPDRKVSTTWNRQTKQIAGLALVRHPRVTDAALMAAFAGARHSAADTAALQQIHDIARDQGATCPDPPDSGAEQNVGTSPQAHPIGPHTGFSKGKRRMKFSEWLTGKAKEEGIDIEDAATFGTSAPDPRIAELEAKLAAQQATFAAQAAAKRSQDAATFADTQVAQARVLPAGRDRLAALYATCAAADDAGQTVTFSDGTVTSHLDTLAAFCAALPTHTLVGSTSVPTGATVLANFSTPNPDGPISEERRKQLLGLSSLGQAIANGKAN